MKMKTGNHSMIKQIENSRDFSEVSIENGFGKIKEAESTIFFESQNGIPKHSSWETETHVVEVDGAFGRGTYNLHFHEKKNES